MKIDNLKPGLKSFALTTTPKTTPTVETTEPNDQVVFGNAPLKDFLRPPKGVSGARNSSDIVSAPSKGQVAQATSSRITTPDKPVGPPNGSLLVNHQTESLGPIANNATTLVQFDEPQSTRHLESLWSQPLNAAPKHGETIEELGQLISQARVRGLREGIEATEPRPDLFAATVEKLWADLNSPEMKKQAASDPYVKALHTQTVTTLKHVRLNFVRRDADYVHKDVLKGPYTFEPTLAALKDSRNFLRVLDADEATEITAKGTPGQIQTEMQTVKDRQKAYMKGVIDEPLAHYQDFRTRLIAEGPEAKFPEFEDVIKYLDLHLQKEGVIEQAQSNKHLAVAHKIASETLSEAKKNGYPYRQTVETVQDSLAFLDIYERGKPGSEARPDLYHSHRYQYYASFIKNETPEHLVFPTIYSLGATDLLKTRGVPIGFVGVPPEISWVDGYTQTPLEFWNHDINHVRRMWQFTQEHAEAAGVPLQDYIKESDRYLRDDVLPIIAIKKTDSPDEKNEKRMMKLILFEAMHEDALPADPAVLKQSLMRAPNTRTPFEKIINEEKSVEYLMEPGATTLAYVYRKAAGMFYDMPSMRMENIVGVDYRTQDFVAQSAKTLNHKLHLGVSDTLIEAYTKDDTGMPDDFRFQLEQQLEQDPSRMAPLNMTSEAKKG